MEYVIIMAVLAIVVIILAIVYEVNIKKLKQFAESEENKFNNIADKYPSNVEICKAILNKLKNTDVKVEEDKEMKTCLYIAISNKIIIANVKNSYTRIQTIAHECLHSVQSRKILLFNFVFSNIYILYFLIVAVFGIFKLLPNKMLFLSIMILLSYVYYFVRSYLENDAMIKARYLSKDYMEEQGISSKQEVEKIIDSFDKLNNMGIKITNFQLMLTTVIKILILSIIFIIR